MDAIIDTVFSFWLSDEQTKQVNAHVKENFNYIAYRHQEKGKDCLGAINKVTREIMWPEPVCVVHWKCVMVLIGNPIRMIGQLSFELIRGAIRVVHAVFTCDVDEFCMVIAEILKVPYYAVGIELAAFIGLFYDSLKGRERIGLMELMLNDYRPHDEKNTFFLARCCQPWVYNIDKDKKYKILAYGSSPQALGFKNDFKECPLLTERSMCC